MHQFQKAEWRSAAKFVAVCAALIPLLAGCILSENPLSTEKYQDDALLGHWWSDENPKNVMELDVSRLPSGDYKIVETESNEGTPRVTTYTASLTKGTRANYANMLMPREKKSDAYMIFEYVVKNNELHLRSGNFDKLKAEMEAGRLKGTFNQTTWGNNMEITNPGVDLLKMFDSADGGQYFGEELVFSRTADTTTAAVTAVLKAQADAWNAGDLDKFMTAYAKSDDITYVSAEGEVRGYAALEERYRKKYGASRDTMGTLAFSDLQIRPLGINTALGVGQWHVERKGQPELHGIFSLVLMKNADGWKIIHDHTSAFAAVTEKK